MVVLSYYIHTHIHIHTEYNGLSSIRETKTDLESSVDRLGPGVGSGLGLGVGNSGSGFDRMMIWYSMIDVRHP